jgi:PqqD family protein of HPr-rel-A system
VKPNAVAPSPEEHGPVPVVRYRTLTRPELMVSWGSDCSVFNPLTGDTHLISILPAEILWLLSDGPLGAREIAERMAELCETPNSPAWNEKIDALLEGLMREELIEPLAR